MKWCMCFLLFPTFVYGQTSYKIQIDANINISITPQDIPTPPPPPPPPPPPNPDIVKLPLLFDIGPGQDFETIKDVDWRGLQPNTEIRLHWRTEPYHAKLMLSQSNVILKGIAGPNGERPVISGKNAVSPLMPLLYKGHQPRFLVLISGAPKPKNVTVQGIEIRDAYDGESFTDMDGNESKYTIATGVWLERGDDILIKDCLFQNLVHGFFSSNGGGSEEVTSRRLTVDSCEVVGCGDATGVADECCYTECDITVCKNLKIHDARHPTTTAYHSRDGQLTLDGCIISSGGVCVLSNSATEADCLFPKEAGFGTMIVKNSTIVSTSDSESLSLRTEIPAPLAKYNLVIKDSTLVKIKAKTQRYYSCYAVGQQYIPNASLTFDACTMLAVAPTDTNPTDMYLCFGTANTCKVLPGNKIYLQTNGLFGGHQYDGGVVFDPKDWINTVEIIHGTFDETMKKAKELAPNLSL